MSFIFDILLVFGFTLLMLGVGFIRLQAKAGLREQYQPETTE